MWLEKAWAEADSYAQDVIHECVQFPYPLINSTETRKDVFARVSGEPFIHSKD